ncbi:unnamed protein product [Meganyctiphanes norvegica]|uniref:Uncharacterized protein n=1 Tax=Meganyctiphanes norvegica TaxID=48144 RepID=A0AAV2Q5C2_MEGNR
MEKNKSQIILLDKSGLETMAKVLSANGWTLSEGGGIEMSSSLTSPVRGSPSQLTLAQGNIRPVTQVSVSGGHSNSNSSRLTSTPSTTQNHSVSNTSYQRDNSQVTTLTELGKKLVAAAKVGNTSQVRRLMAIGAPFATEGPIGMTPLHLAAQNGHLETCQRLLCAGMNKDARNKVDKTPLHLAAMEGHTDIVKLLIREGANLDALDFLRMTALHWAVDRGHVDIVKILLKKRARIDFENKFSKIPLHLAIEHNFHDIVELLQEDVSEYKEEEEANVAVESIALGDSEMEDSLGHVPHVVNTEEVHTQEITLEEICHTSQRHERPKTNSQAPMKNSEECITNVESHLPHSIMADDGEDQSTSVLATLAELAEATSRNADSSIEVPSAVALELLRTQAALLPLDDTSLLTTALSSGQTLQLTEAGKQAMRLIKPDPLLPFNASRCSGFQEQESQREEEMQNRKKMKNSHKSNSPKSSSCLSSSQQTKYITTDIASSKSSVDDVNTNKDIDCDPSETEEVSQMSVSEEVAQVITLSPEQYAALTGGISGPIILQVLPHSGELQRDESASASGQHSESQKSVKKQKLMQLVTRPGYSHTGQPVVKVKGEVINVDLPPTVTQPS